MEVLLEQNVPALVLLEGKIAVAYGGAGSVGAQLRGRPRGSSGTRSAPAARRNDLTSQPMLSAVKVDEMYDAGASMMSKT